jgi:hypothetical protein
MVISTVAMAPAVFVVVTAVLGRALLLRIAFVVATIFSSSSFFFFSLQFFSGLL